MAATDAQADDDRRGTAGSTQLLVPLTARGAVFGANTSGLRSMSGVEAMFSNPAALTLNTGSNAIFSRMEYVAEIDVNYFAFAQRIGNNQVAISLNTWDFGDIPLQTEASPDISDVTYTANYTTLAGAFARQFTDRIAAGLTVKFVSERIDDVSSGGLAVDGGMTYEVGESGLRLGVALSNFGASRNYSGTGLVRFVQLQEQAPDAQTSAVVIEGSSYELPSLLSFGVSYTRNLAQGATLSALGNFRSNSFSADQYSGALEVGLRNILFLRGGYQLQADMDQSMYTGVNLGAGINLDLNGTAFGFDYAYRGTDFFDDVHMITTTLTL
jgi:hypothetical protein